MGNVSSGVGKGLLLIDGEAAASIQGDGVYEGTSASSRRSKGSRVTPKRGTLTGTESDGTTIRAAVSKGDVPLPGLGTDMAAQTEQADQHDPPVMKESLSDDDKNNDVWVHIPAQIVHRFRSNSSGAAASVRS